MTQFELCMAPHLNRCVMLDDSMTITSQQHEQRNRSVASSAMLLDLEGGVQYDHNLQGDGENW